MTKRRATLALAFLIAIGTIAPPLPALATSWEPDHVVLVVLENRSFAQVIGDPGMPYLNSLAQSGALMTRSRFAQLPYGIVSASTGSPLPARPSQPNYLYLFSGHHQGVIPDWFLATTSPYLGSASYDSLGKRLPAPIPNAPTGIGNRLIPASLRPFTTPNLGAAIIASGKTFATFSESLPHPSYDAPDDPDPRLDLYRRKHNPAINWIDFGLKSVRSDSRRFTLPIESNLGFRNTVDPTTGRSHRGFAVDAMGRPTAFARLPTVSLVVPNDEHNLHSGGNAAADAWLRSHIKPYADWARDHNSLLIITFDEDGATDASRGDPDTTGIDRIVTIFHGAEGKLIPGRYDEPIDHLNVLSTILDRYGLLEAFKRDFSRAHTGAEARHEYANLRPIRDIFGEGPKLAPIGGI